MSIGCGEDAQVRSPPLFPVPSVRTLARVALGRQRPRVYSDLMAFFLSSGRNDFFPLTISRMARIGRVQRKEVEGSFWLSATQAKLPTPFAPTSNRIALQSPFTLLNYTSQEVKSV